MGTPLIQLLDGLPVTCHGVTPELHVNDLVEDTRRVTPGSIFLAREGRTFDGREHIDAARERGAVAVLTDEYGAGRSSLPTIQCVDPAMVGARLAERLHGDPSRRIQLVGITGTNGKSTTAIILHHLLNGETDRCGLIGGIHVDDGAEQSVASLTTPQASDLSRILGRMVRNGCTRAVMEVSSHALDLGRVHSLSFHGAIFTNLSGDHLDWHGDMVQYAIAKRRLFAMLPDHGVAVVNAEDSRSGFMAQAAPCRVIEAGAGSTAQCVCLEEHLDGSRARFEGPWGTMDGIEAVLPLVGRHNLQNALLAVTMAQQLGVPPERIAERLATCPCPPGRLEPIPSPPGSCRVFVDFAHTDGALGSTLTSLRRVIGPEQRLVTVFGCGGDRDATKRPRMGAAAVESSDSVIITSDNPRTEDPHAIIDDVLEGIPEDRRSDVVVEPDRAAAIRRAITDADDRSVVLIAGKGHEQVQITGDRRVPFDDRVVAQAALNGCPTLRRHLQSLTILDRATGELPPITGISIDSRTIRPGELYICIVGQTHDGHDFIRDAIQRGASAVLVETVQDDDLHLPWIRVQDTRAALVELATMHRSSLDVPVIGITGTCGKTGTKELLRCVLQEAYEVCASPRSYNNDIGLPLTLLTAGPQHECVVLEMGTSSPGEIQALARIARPTHAIITMVGHGHLEALRDRTGVAREKYSLLPHVRDHAWVREDVFPLPSAVATIDRFGADSPLGPTDVQVEPDGTRFRLADGTEFRIAASGAHHASNAVPVVLLARRLGLDDARSQAGLDAYRPPRGRGEQFLIDDIEFVDETYNANPDSMTATIDSFLAEDDQARNILVLGDMLELGDQSGHHHESLGRFVATHHAASSIDLVMLVGQEVQHTARAMASAGWSGDRILHEPEIDDDAVRRIASMLQPGDRVLLKASRSIGLERIHVARARWDSEVSVD
ncbi:MAG: UDP-N-acetylmuramoyl-L-alanyl-D-glutamate--2,6-diaminopimelate ligase [Planctomycetota bacterium]|nr:UDP-N-acetylmuramoyl-L-alanyl-D-glutamate--2,6-diaminopimelate ligase [Planctomycetota bacterium]